MLDTLHMSKHLARLAITIITMMAIPGLAIAQQNGLGIAAVVNEDVISVLDLHSRRAMIIASSDMVDSPETRARISPQVLRGLIDEKLMLQEAQRIGIEVHKEDIQGGVRRIAQSNNITVEQLENNMLNMGSSPTSLTSRIESEIAWQIFVGRSLSRKIKISDEEINDEIERIQASAGKPEYLLAEIFLPVDKPGQDGEVQQLAMRLMEQMKVGAAFKAIASNFSRSPTAQMGGDMGWVQASHLDPTLLNVVRQMKPGTVAMPIRTLGGYYLMLLRETRTSPGLQSGETSMKITQLHLLPTPQADMNQIAAQLTTMTAGVTSCATLDAIGKQSGSPMSGSMGLIKMSALPPPMRTVLSALAVGQPSKPIATGGGVAVMMVCERTNKAVDMEVVRADIEKRLKLKRLDIAAQRHLRDLRRMAFVDIRL